MVGIRGAFNLYEDDGETFDFERGVQDRVTLSWSSAGGKVERVGHLGLKRYDVVGWDVVN